MGSLASQYKNSRRSGGSPAVFPDLWRLSPTLSETLLTVILVGNSKLLAAMSAARCQHATTILRCHSLAETVLVHPSAVVRLKCSLHFLYYFYVTNPTFGVQS